MNNAGLVEKIIELYGEDINTINSHPNPNIMQRELFGLTSFKYIEECVIGGVIDNKSMWQVKKELDDYSLLSHVYFMFECFGVGGCLDYEYQEGMVGYGV